MMFERLTTVNYFGAVALAFCNLLAPTQTSAQTASDPAQVDLQLVLAVDVSGSVNQFRFELQRAGYATAFRNPEVIGAIHAGANSSIAVTMVQWTGPPIASNRSALDHGQGPTECRGHGALN